jgi:hypothetical protein
MSSVTPARRRCHCVDGEFALNSAVLGLWRSRDQSPPRRTFRRNVLQDLSGVIVVHPQKCPRVDALIIHKECRRSTFACHGCVSRAADGYLAHCEHGRHDRGTLRIIRGRFALLPRGTAVVQCSAITLKELAGSVRPACRPSLALSASGSPARLPERRSRSEEAGAKKPERRTTSS